MMTLSQLVLLVNYTFFLSQYNSCHFEHSLIRTGELQLSTAFVLFFCTFHALCYLCKS